MAGNIKGITIEFRGDTTKLDKALRTIKNDSKAVDAQLRNVNKALRFNPGNAELMAQKQTLLKQKIKSTKDELNAFKTAEKQLKAQNVDKQSQEWMEVRRNIIQCESKLKHFNGELKRVAAPQLAALGKSFQTAGQKMRSAGTGMTIAGAGMIYAGKKLLELSQIQADAENKLTEIYEKRMGVSEKAAKSTMKLASAIQQEGVVGDEVTLSGAQQLATFAKYPGTVNKLLPAMDNLLVQQKGMNASAEDATGIANLMGKALMGQTGALKKCGISFTDAQAEILKYGTEEEKAATLAEVITQNVGDMNKKFAETDAGKIQQAKNALGDAGERLGAVLLPALAQLAKWVNDSIMPKIEALISFVEAHPIIAKIALAVTGLLVVGGPLIIFIGSICSAIGVLIPLVGTLSAVSLPITGTMLLIAAAIAAVVAIGVLLYKNWDKIKAKALSVWTVIKTKIKSAINAIKNTFNSLIQAGRRIISAFASIGRKLAQPFETARNLIRKAINKIKNVVNNAKLSLPHFKLPHFNIKGGKLPWGIGGKGVKPTISVSWYKNGGIFTKPTLLGGNNGVGEAGSEAVLPLSQLWTQMDAMNSNMAATVVDGVSEAMSGINATIVIQLDKEVLAKITTPVIKKEMNRIDKMNNRKLGYV